MRDNGEIEMFNAYRVQHDNSRGPFKGGFRFSPQVSMDEVRRYALPPSLSQALPEYTQPSLLQGLVARAYTHDSIHGEPPSRHSSMA